jgi:hypothetical protein
MSQNVLLYPLALGVLDSVGALIGLWSAPVLGYGVGDIDIVAYRGDDIKLEEFKISKTSRAGET